MVTDNIDPTITAPADVTREVTGMEIGGVTPFGIPDGFPIYVDARIPSLERCVVGGGSRSMKVTLDPEVFTRMPRVEVVEGLATDPGARGETGE